MAVAEVNIERKRGDTRRHIFTIKDDSGNVVDISGWIDFMLAIDPDPLPIDAGNNIEVIVGAFTTDGTDGKVHFIPGVAVPIGAYFYDAQAKDDNVELITFVKGTYQVIQDICKAV